MRYKKKPVEIEAFQFKGSLCYADTGEWCVPEWAVEAYHEGIIFEQGDEYYIRTLEGNHHISCYDYVIKGVQGELYPCKPDIFEMTYKPVEALGEEELDGWQTGVPTEEGDYVVKTKANYTVLTYKDGLWWISDNVPIPPSIGYVRAYGQKITPYEES